MRFAIVGKQCSGKTMVAQLMKTMYTGNFVTLKFAEPIYDVLNILEQKKNRRFMQEFSDLTKIYFGENIFVNLLERKLKNLNFLFADDDILVVCDDVRYQNEVDLLKKYGFLFVLVEANQALRKERAIKQGLEFYEDHSSEKIESLDVGNCYYFIDNNYHYIQPLERRVREFMEIHFLR